MPSNWLVSYGSQLARNGYTASLVTLLKYYKANRLIEMLLRLPVVHDSGHKQFSTVTMPARSLSELDCC